ncbi:TlpA disulfide reductase family protein [Bacillus sp. 1P06AnD]|uniref:TlpA disulfide reductase family protein n=1 Tax=Bacillus sp. 1P06AnD TaxID=3132208 RepID=UPI00399F7305
MKKKHIITAAILVIAIIIVVINIWNPSFSGTNEKEKAGGTKEEAVSTGTKPSLKGPSVDQGATAPDFERRTLDHQVEKLSSYRGKKVILNLWASWCPPCKAEMPHMENYYKEKMTKDEALVSVNLTSLEKQEADVQSFIETNKITFPILMDDNGSLGQIYQAYTIPTSYLIDRKGKIVQKIVGPMDEQAMKKLYDSIE